MLLFSAITLHAYATTAKGAAIAAMYVDPKHPPIVERVNFAGAYAAVLTKGGRMEGEFVTFPILVQRFSFGWQAIDALNFYCNLQAHHLGRNSERTLMREMPAPKDDRPCRGRLLKDAGPRDDIEVVRKMMRRPLVPYVVVAGSWAMGEWYGAGGGETLFEKRAGDWHLVEDGGGAMGVDDMRKFGVPQADWCRFGVFDARCR